MGLQVPLSLFIFDFKFTLIYLLKLSFSFIAHCRYLLKYNLGLCLLTSSSNQEDIRWGVTFHLPKPARNKHEPRVVKCVFIGYGVTQKGYQCFDPIHKKLYTTMDCDFIEISYYYTQPRPQGETVSDDLSQLTHPTTINPDPTIHDLME